jgi:hypothetical protein
MNADKCIQKLSLGKCESGHLEYKELDRQMNINSDLK